MSATPSTSHYDVTSEYEYMAPEKELPSAGSLGPEPLNNPSEFLKDDMMQLVALLFNDPDVFFDKPEYSRVYELANITPSIDRGLAAACEMPCDTGLRVWDLSELQGHCRYGLWAPPCGFMSENLLNSTFHDAARRLCYLFKMCRQRFPSGYLTHLEDILVIASLAEYFGIFVETQKNRKRRDFRKTLTQLLLPEEKPYGKGTKDNLLLAQVSLHPANAVLLLKLAEITCHSTLYREAGRHVIGVYEHIEANEKANEWFSKILDRRTVFAVHEEYARVRTALRCAMMFSLNTMQFDEETFCQQKLDHYIQGPSFKSSLLDARLFIVRALADNDDLNNLTEGTWPPKNMWMGIEPSVLEKKARKSRRSRNKRNVTAYFKSQQLGQTDNFHPKVSNVRYILRQLYANNDLWETVLTPQSQAMESWMREKLSSMLPLRAVPTIQKRRLQDLKKDTEKEIFRSAMSLPDKMGPRDPIFALLREQVGHCLEKLVGDGTFREDGTPVVGEAGSYTGCQKPNIDERALDSRHDLFSFLHNFHKMGVPYLLCGNLSPPGYFTDASDDDIYPKLNLSTPDLRKIMGTFKIAPVFKSGASKSVGALPLLLPGSNNPVKEVLKNNDYEENRPVTKDILFDSNPENKYQSPSIKSTDSAGRVIIDKKDTAIARAGSEKSTTDPKMNKAHIRSSAKKVMPAWGRKGEPNFPMASADADRLLADCLALFDNWVSSHDNKVSNDSNNYLPTKSASKTASMKTRKWYEEVSRPDAVRPRDTAGNENTVHPVIVDQTSNEFVSNNIHQLLGSKTTAVR